MVPVDVDAYSGYKANERPRQFVLDEEIYEIATVLDQWYEPSAMYFKVQSTEGKTYLLRYDEQEDEWTLQSGLMPMNCWRDRALNWSQSIQRCKERRTANRIVRARTAMMLRFRSTGF